ncbi:MAG: M81 family metallopeptidase [Pseudomonadota bacterium]
MATLSTETNTFSSMPTAISGFKEYFLRFGNATQEPPNLMTEALHVWRSKAEELGWDVVESIAAIAEPAGKTTTACYEFLRNRIFADLTAAGGADIVLLQLHGAMVAEHVDDCEGDIVSEVRRLCPNATIGLALDLHCHLTQEMVENCDVINCFKEYPHDDASDRAEELFELARRTRAGEINPVMSIFDCRMIHLYLTKNDPMRSFVDRMKSEEEAPNILSVSLAHGFPWADVCDVGAKMLVVADGDADLASGTAERLGQEFFDLRNKVTGDYSALSCALDLAQTIPAGPVVLADMGDNSGGGAPGDSTFMLDAILKRNLTNVATGIYWDPLAVRLCKDAGIGIKLRLRIGGKVGPDSGDPVDVEVEVIAIKEGLGQHLGKGLEPLGTVVWLRTANDVDILINDLRTQVYHPEAFEQMGIDLSGKAIVTVKSLFHFYGPFEKIASRVIQVATSGGTSPSFTNIAYGKRDHNYWPKVADPFRQ